MGVEKPNIRKKIMKLNWNFLGGGGEGVQKKKLSIGEYGYFLELHIMGARFRFPNLTFLFLYMYSICQG